MSHSVAQAIESRSQSLFEKLVSNVDVANIVMALIGRLVIMATEQGKPIEGIAVENAEWSGRSLRARVRFNSVVLPSATLWQKQSDLHRYAESRARHLAKVFDKNPGLLRFFNDLAVKLESFCETKRLNFSDLKFEKSIITKENLLILNVAKNHLNPWER